MEVIFERGRVLYGSRTGAGPLKIKATVSHLKKGEGKDGEPPNRYTHERRKESVAGELNKQTKKC